MHQYLIRLDDPESAVILTETGEPISDKAARKILFRLRSHYYRWTWYVYLARGCPYPESHEHGSIQAIKIGLSNDPVRRCKSLRAALLHQFQCESKEEARYVEWTLHQHYAKKHVTGEWFNLDAIDLERLTEYKQTTGILTNLPMYERSWVGGHVPPEVRRYVKRRDAKLDRLDKLNR